MSNINLKKFVHSYLRKTIIKDINLSYKKKNIHKLLLNLLITKLFPSKSPSKTENRETGKKTMRQNDK